MKKNTKKNAGAQKPAPTAKSAAPKPAAKKAASAKTAEKPAAVQKKAPSKPAAKRAAKPAVKPAAKPAKQATMIAARINTGYGNRVFIRGEGPGLSWDRGVPMECKDADRWQWSVEGVEKPFAFKLLINDQLWSHGENDEALPGRTKVVEPRF